MKIQIFFKFLLLTSLCVNNVFAKEPNVINKTDCLDKTSNDFFYRLAEIFTDYGRFHEFDNKTKPDLDLGIIKLHYIDMIRSKPLVLKDGPVSQHLIEFLMAPIYVKNQKHFVHFFMNCWIDSRTELLRYGQKCKLQKTISQNGENVILPKFGVDSFDLSVKLYEEGHADHKCQDNQVQLSYDIKIFTNTKDIESIKNDASQGSDLIKRMIDTVFNEEVFFKRYYQKAYKVLLESVK